MREPSFWMLGFQNVTLFPEKEIIWPIPLPPWLNVQMIKTLINDLNFFFYKSRINYNKKYVKIGRDLSNVD